MKEKDKETTITDRVRAVMLIVWTVIYAKSVFVPICTSLLIADIGIFILVVAFAFAFYIAVVGAIYGKSYC